MNMLKNSQGADVNYGEALKYSKTVIDGGFQPTMRNYKLLLQTIRRSAKKTKIISRIKMISAFFIIEFKVAMLFIILYLLQMDNI